jgi:hypothetical protein
MFQRCAITVLLLGCMTTSAAALPQSTAPANEDMQATIDGMRDASTWGHRISSASTRVWPILPMATSSRPCGCSRLVLSTPTRSRR